MRFLFIFALAAFSAGAAAADPPNAQQALVERFGLLELDARCRLLEPGPRVAVQAGAGQARGALLRAGWTPARISTLETAVTRAARDRACNDPRTQAAVADAHDAYTAWANATSMNFPGWTRTWTARRTTGVNGWRLSQPLETPNGAVFGVREVRNAQTLALILTGDNAATVRMVVRDAARSRPGPLDLPARVARGLEAGAPETGSATRAFSGTRTLERRPGGVTQSVYAFPHAAFAALLALDPRESVRLELSTGRTVQIAYVEVGDVAAARAFLTLRAD